MRIVVQYSAQFSQAAGAARESIDVDAPCTVQQLVLSLASERRSALRALLLDGSSRLRPHVLLCVRDEQIYWDSPSPLRDGDEVLLFSPISGG